MGYAIYKPGELATWKNACVCSQPIMKIRQGGGPLVEVEYVANMHGTTSFYTEVMTVKAESLQPFVDSVTDMTWEEIWEKYIGNFELMVRYDER